MKELFTSTPIRILASLTMFMLLLALGSYASLNFERIQHLETMPATITVSGEGEVFAVPDVGQFTFSVQAQAADAAAAQEESGRAVDEIVTFLKEAGVEDADIKTTSYNLWPRYRWEERLCVSGFDCGPAERIQDGFEVNQSVMVKVRNTDDASSIIGGVGERGATNISGLDFVIDDTDALQAEARAQAIADAKTKAQVLANDLGVKLVRIMGYSEGGGGYVAPQMFQARSLDMAEEAAFDGPALPMGEEQMNAQVTITYEVR